MTLSLARPRRLQNLLRGVFFSKPAPLQGPLGQAVASPAGTGQQTHVAWDKLLTTHLRDGRVDYIGLRDDYGVLHDYLALLADTDIQALTRTQRLAYLINAYNAFTVDLILRQRTLPGSILDISHPWTRPRWILSGTPVSLDTIEHGLIRPGFRDPRIHFALNCASVGCPPLQPFAMNGAILDEQLTAACRHTLSDTRYAHMQGKRLALTRILQVYAKDFIDAQALPRADHIVDWITPYVPDQLATSLSNPRPRIRWLPYDWSLNQQDIAQRK